MTHQMQNPGDEYDFASLRDKIKNAWGIKKKSEDSGALKKKFQESFDEEEKNATIAGKNRKSKRIAASHAVLKDKKYLAFNSSQNPGFRSDGRGTGKVAVSSLWTSDRAAQWVLYEAVLGLPRSRNPWKPVR
ncbi:hypothetical protein [uncultured Dialister sp.]|uniref:hypothetical protein n=1 Tax=uncultured Dialister sp. TaxID=278064 RepID=UPI0025E4ACA0|nr:hypothetical protein [uncultured Dialister sp.]